MFIKLKGITMRIKDNDKTDKSGKETAKGADNSEKKGRRFHHPPKKDPQAILTLRYGPSHNFMLFKEAMSKKELVDYGNLGKLIKQGSIILPNQLNHASYDLEDDNDSLNKIEYLEDMKAYHRELADFRRDKPKLYALLLQHLSDESLDAVQKEVQWTKIEENADPEGLWQLIELKHKVHSTSKVEAVVKLAARTQLAMMRQGAFESIVAFKKRYTNALKVYKDQKNPDLSKVDEAMDFFSKLDNTRYAEFKTTYLNNLQLKACNPPADLNEIFTLVNTYLKLKAATGGGFASTFTTTVDTVDKSRRRRGRKGKNDQPQWAWRTYCLERSALLHV